MERLHFLLKLTTEVSESNLLNNVCFISNFKDPGNFCFGYQVEILQFSHGWVGHPLQNERTR